MYPNFMKRNDDTPPYIVIYIVIRKKNCKLININRLVGIGTAINLLLR